MKRRARVFLLLCLMALAAHLAQGAYLSIRPGDEAVLPDELYSSLLSASVQAQYLLRSCGGYIAVYPNRRGASPERITRIELSTLREADRAMLRRGIPAADFQSMLQFLEDLGS